jgi:hypothetical protein
VGLVLTNTDHDQLSIFEFVHVQVEAATSGVGQGAQTFLSIFLPSSTPNHQRHKRDMSGKRSHAALLEDERSTITIQLNDGVAIHGVDLQLLSLLSSCARGLPADAVCWDLSQLLVSLSCCFVLATCYLATPSVITIWHRKICTPHICLCAVDAAQVEGQPVQRPTVIAYLNSAYKHAYGEPFKETPQQEEQAAQKPKKRKQQRGQQQGEPEQQADCQHASRQCAGVTTFAGMTQLLLFADAVGSTAPLLRACAAGVDKLSLHVQLPTGVELGLSIRTPYIWDSITSSSPKLAMVSEQQRVRVLATISAADGPAAKAALVQQVQAQTEALLYATYKLQLADAAEAVQGFISMQTTFLNSVLREAMRHVMSPRVVDAAAGYKSLQETLLLNHLVTRPCSFAYDIQGPYAPTVPKAFVPVDFPAEQQQLKFTAEAVQDGFGSSKGQQVPVEVNLITSIIKLGDVEHKMHAVLGPMICTEEAKQAMLGPAAPATD